MKFSAVLNELQINCNRCFAMINEYKFSKLRRTDDWVTKDVFAYILFLAPWFTSAELFAPGH